jgi:hypothetical protein
MQVQELHDYYWKTFQSFFNKRGVIKRLFDTVPVSNNRLNNFFAHLFYQKYNMKKVNSHDHPYSGGIDRIQ